MKNKRLITAIIATVILVAVGAITYRQLFAAQTDDPAAGTVTQTAVSTPTTIQAEGHIIPLRDVALSFSDNGEIATLFVSKGDIVAAGDPLLRLDTIDQEIALMQAEAALAQAQANLQAATAALQATQTGLALAESDVTAATIDLDELLAEPTAAEVAVREAAIAAAAAGITQAAGQQAVLREGPTASQLHTAEARLLAAQAQIHPITDVLGAFYRYEIDDADAEEMLRLQLNAAQANVNAAQAALDELSTGASAAELQAATGAVGAAAAQRDAAQAQLDLLLTGPKPEQVALLETAVSQAEARVAEAALAVSQAETAISQAETAVSQAELRVASTGEALAQRTLTAPFAGTVADLPVELGEIATAGAPVITLADFGGWQVETTDLSELDVVNITTGTEVIVTLDAMPGESLSGTITNVAAVSGLNRGDVTYRLTIALEARPDLPLRWGMTALVHIDMN